MQYLPNFSLGEILSLVEITVLLIATFSLVVFAKAATRLRMTQREVAQTLQKLESDLRLIALDVSATDDRVSRLEKESTGIKAAQDHLESRGSAQSNYAQAVNLVQRGWRIDDVVSNCGLSRGEAELVYLLHGPGGALTSDRSVKHSKVNAI